MKLFSIIGVILFLTHAHADDLDLLKQCQVSCNSSCRTLALKLKPLIQDAEGCTGSTEVTRRCSYHFSGSQAQVCAANATTVEVVNRCYYHFSNSDSASRCAGNGKSVAQVNECIRQYGSSDAGLTCIAGR
ncbi:MAG: hypothetical protein B7Y39_12900 [Bdellovibrio sp. 28-41-41]|nr:MAG: hypothetical protein B7Y39_12900 [Bdellovibrio sp. 28-41-41]